MLRLLLGVLSAVQVSNSSTLTSWYRSREHNARVGGHAESQHLLATGLDVVPDRASWNAVAARGRASGLVVLDEGDHLHFQALPYGFARTAGIFDVLYV